MSLVLARFGGMQGCRAIGCSGEIGRQAWWRCQNRCERAFDCVPLTGSGDVFESLWERVRGMEREGVIVVGLYYCWPSQDVSTEELFYRLLKDFWISSLCPYGSFQLPKHQQRIHYCCDEHILKILEVCRR